MEKSDDYDGKIQELCDIYGGEAEIAFVVGAGVTKDSGVPNWIGLGLTLFEKAKQKGWLVDFPEPTAEFLDGELRRWKNREGTSAGLDPETVLLLVCEHVESRDKILELVYEALFEKIVTRAYKKVAARTYRENKTLEALITFCAAKEGNPIADKSKGRWRTNCNVGAVLTTNYDNLVEGAFNSKYERHLLHPVAREGAREVFEGRRIIPVYHMHGYISYLRDRHPPRSIKASELVLTEKDYYRTFHNPLGFSNLAAGSLFRKYHAIFVGCSMTDRNMRRILYLLEKERVASSDLKRHFAILPGGGQRDKFDDAVFNSFGVTSIRVPGGAEIGTQVADILKRIYLSAKGVKEEHWIEAWKGK